MCVCSNIYTIVDMYTGGCDCGSSDDDDLSTGAVVAISVVVTFIITLAVTTLISVIITRMFYEHKNTIGQIAQGHYQNGY